MKKSLELIAEAKRTPNGWVYVLDKEFKGKEEVPPEFIKGAWKVNEKGIIVGSFIPNKNYKGKNKTKTFYNNVYKKLLKLVLNQK
jgi:hypothetical protein